MYDYEGHVTLWQNCEIPYPCIRASGSNLMDSRLRNGVVYRVKSSHSLGAL